MLTTLEITTPAFPDGLTVELRGIASAVVSGPNGAGKSTTARAIEALLTGEPPAGWKVTGATGKGTQLLVTGRRREVAVAGQDPRPATSADAYRALLGAWADDAELTRAILHEGAFLGLVGTVDHRGLRDLLTRVLPAGDLRAAVAELMAPHELRAGDPLHLADEGPRGAKTLGALSLQTSANDAEKHAAGVLSAARAELERARAAVPADLDTGALDAHRATLAAADAWGRYRVDVAAWDAYDTAHAAWKARDPGEAPAHDGPAHQAARMLVERLEREERDAEKAAAAKQAREEAEARAAVEAELAATRAEAARLDAVARARREAEAVATVAPPPTTPPAAEPTPTTPLSLFPGIVPEPPRPLTVECPECGHTWSPS